MISNSTASMFCILVALSVATIVQGYGSGAPASACISMTPGHGSEQSGATPYSLSIGGVTTYTPGTTISITVNGGAFKGMLLQARRADGSSTVPVGKFSNPPSNTRLSNCGNDGDTITHSDTDDKNSPTFTWTAPNEDVGNVKFIATVAQDKYTWWRNHVTSELTYQAGSGGGGDVETTTTSTTTTSTASGLLLLVTLVLATLVIYK